MVVCVMLNTNLILFTPKQTYAKTVYAKTASSRCLSDNNIITKVVLSHWYFIQVNYLHATLLQNLVLIYYLKLFEFV